MSKRDYVKSNRFSGVFSRNGGKSWEGQIQRTDKCCKVGSHATDEAAAKARDKVLYKLDGPECEDFQVRLTQEEMRALDALALEELLAQLKRSQPLFHRQGTSKYRGVKLRKNTGKWQAAWQGKNKQHFTCDDEEEAARAYDRFVLEELGRDALTNFQYSEEDLDRICGAAGNVAAAAQGGAAAAGNGNRATGQRSRSRTGKRSGRRRKAASDSEDEATAGDASTDEDEMDADTAAAGGGIAKRLRVRSGLRQAVGKKGTDEESSGDDDSADEVDDFDFPTEPECTEDETPLPPPAKRSRASAAAAPSQTAAGGEVDLSSLEFAPGWEEYFMPPGFGDRPLGALDAGERPWAPNPYDMGKRPFLEFAMREQKVLQAKGDRVLEEVQRKREEDAAACKATAGAASAGDSAAAGQAGTAGSTGGSGDGGDGGTSAAGRGGNDGTGGNGAGQGSHEMAAVGRSSSGGMGDAAASQPGGTSTGHSAGAGASADPADRASTYVRPHDRNAFIDEWFATHGVPPPDAATGAAPAGAKAASGAASGSAAGTGNPEDDAAVQEALRKHWLPPQEMLARMTPEELADVEKFTAWGVAFDNFYSPGQMPPEVPPDYDLYAGLEEAPSGALPGSPEWLAWSERREKALVEKVERACGI